MATVTEVTTAPLSGLNYIDALLDDGPAWNYLAPGTGNTISYTFSTTGGTQSSSSIQSAPQAFSAAQQAATRVALAYLSSITGIIFAETSSGTAAKVHFAYADIVSPNTSGLCSWGYNYSYKSGDVVTAYNASAYIYLDNVQWGGQNSFLGGGQGLETLLHEMGHMMGLKHPFEGDIVLPAGSDTTANTLMSYTDSGGPYASYSQYDLAALKWLYGGDGLGGLLGVGSSGGGRYYTGTSANDALTAGPGNDALEGAGGSDTLNGGAGTDTAIYAGARSGYAVAKSAGGYTVADLAGGGTDLLVASERIKFADKMLAIDIDGAGGQAYRVYQAAFNRAPDLPGLGYWIGVMDRGVGLGEVAANFMTSAEFITLYGSATPSNATLVNLLYSNVLHRAPDAAGAAYWLDVLNKGLASQAAVLASFSDSPENYAQVIGAIQNGFEYTPFV